MDIVMLLEDLEDYLEGLFKKNGIKASLIYLMKIFILMLTIID